VTLAALIDHADTPAVLKQAAEKAATPQIRNAATVGGNLAQRPRCWYFRSPAFLCRKKGGETCYSQNGDNRYHAVFDHDECAIVHPSNLAPALLALDAKVVTNARTLPVAELFALPTVDVARENVLAPGELIREVVIPPGRTGGAYRDARERGSFDWALVSAAAYVELERGVVKAARLAMGGVSPVPRRAAEAEAALVGRQLTAASAQKAAEAALAPATAMTHNGYKIPLARTILRRAILAAAGLPETRGG
jgi:xanthine dehydrogenase YagS FAD-binding subunit